MNNEGKEREVTSGGLPQDGMFQGVANYPPRSEMGFPQPSQPSNATYSSAPPPLPQLDAHGNQTGQVYEGRPTIRGQDPLPCGCGFGWLLFILGFFFGVIPWYVGAIMLFCVKTCDNREKPGLIACVIAAVIGTIVIIIVVPQYYNY
ncbi:hypothetical protein RHSIM_Rhsim06G0187100 [Rhododendron simsii]|uniref:60S ribosomal protein L18a-like protein n=1 Tax=Rhododendron simsii TaxID=118357 RepID=A0A834GV84_RHOSS|nr:hypothetical protein RHSIM_Rhsim06G0187100 [Rhododendron simsii]